MASNSLRRVYQQYKDDIDVVASWPVQSSFSRELEAAGRAVNQASDALHAFFLTVIERVRDSLRPLLNTDTMNMNKVNNDLPTGTANAECTLQ
ncbi:hypothetical protein TW65_05225 [Stemphylium lycopersici]|uniref:Uncharacterized protein n=1 Tax=Stemphylium lycopersici TaxID=183478 RepID=A0A364MUB4_STELY|nr:hypothetical protein TW65_05225 [Stemphylium lycopersici]RAR03876.1 hypothetical protein DDE83_008064 [Stemphylium lycopersici]